MIGAVVLRPEPGNARTVAALRAHGIDTLALPLFAATPVAWEPPDPTPFDAVLFTSANAPRHGGEGLAALRHLPAIAVGQSTADAARVAGFRVVVTGDTDATAVVARAGFCRPLHLAGREHHAAVPDRLIVYASDPLPVDHKLIASRVALLHSARAARRLASLVEPAQVAIAALSSAVLAAAGPGWEWAEAASEPTDAVLIALVVKRLTGPAPRRISGG